MHTNSFSIIENNNPKWQEIISECKEYDFYHTQEYHALETVYRTILAVAYYNEAIIALPLVIRPIVNTDLFDCTSVYGYPGPISNVNFEHISNEHIAFFQKELWQFFKNNKIISAFTRLHPLLKNQNIFSNFGEITNLNNTIAIDLRNTEEEQKKQYRKSIGYDIKQLQKKGFTVAKAKSTEEIDAFIAIYLETMQRVDAKEEYFFSFEYFYKIINTPAFHSKILIAKYDNKVCAGALFLVTNNIMQYHLAGTAKEFVQYSPMKLILEEARSLGCSLKLDYLFLGGGLGRSKDDSLYRFKSGFSNLNFQFQNWKMIVDINEYNKLVAQNNIYENSDYFPLYRNSEKEDNFYVFGASGHAKVIIDILKLKKQKVTGIFDDSPKISKLLGIPVYNFNEIKYKENPGNSLIIAVGDNAIRKKLATKLNGNYVTTIHPSAVISPMVEIQKGTVVMACAIINIGATIGKHVIVNSGALIEHDCIVEDFAHISPKAALAGNVTVGEGAQIGINACIRQGIKIGKWAIVGAGAVIVKEVPDYAVVVGNPGRIIKYTNA